MKVPICLIIAVVILFGGLYLHKIYTDVPQKVATNIVIFDDNDIKMERTDGGLYIINKTPTIKILKISTMYKHKEHVLSYTLNPNTKYHIDIYVKVAKIWIEDVENIKPKFVEI
jgi:hypothetical protein